MNARISIGEDLHSKPVVLYAYLDTLNKEVYDWHDYNKELIKRAFNNHDSEYYYDYSRIGEAGGLADYFRGVNTETFEYQTTLCKNTIESRVNFLKRLVGKLPVIDEQEGLSKFVTSERTFSNKGFIVHGHDDAKKLEVARFIENDLHRKAVILHEQPNKGRTIMEKFESYSSVDFAVALWTSDDIGHKKNQSELNPRARQNVVFETGFFIGKLGRENVVVLFEEGVEIPSDYSGVVFIPFSGNWKDDLRKEIAEIYRVV